MSSFANLKRGRSDLSKLTKAIEATAQPAEGGGADDRFWKPSVDKAGNGMAVLRFLPAPQADGDDALPWIRVFSHGFQGPGGWLIDNCLTTVNQNCPVCEANSTLWNSGIEANKNIARDRKRKLSYIANVLIVSDPSNKENEGQIKLFKFGKKIFDKITEAMDPDPAFADEKPMNPFDMWEGANFKLKIRKVDGYQNYDKSEFESPSAIYDGDDDKLEELWKKEHSLKEFVEPKQFKSYDKLKERLDKVLGTAVPAAVATKAAAASLSEDDDVPFDTSGADDEDLDYFKSLANQD